MLELLGKQIAEHAWSYGMVHDARRVSWMPTDDDVRSVAAYVDISARTLGPRRPVAFVAASAALFGMPHVLPIAIIGRSSRAARSVPLESVGAALAESDSA